jgi:hypothetical protein
MVAILWRVWTPWAGGRLDDHLAVEVGSRVEAVEVENPSKDIDLAREA